MISLFLIQSCCKFIKICLFLLGCLLCWYIIIHSVLLWFFCASVVSVVISSLLFLIYLGLLSLFSWWSWLKVYQFYSSFQKKKQKQTPALSFTELHSCFLVSILFISSLIFPPADFGLCLFVFLISNSLKC